MTAAWPGRFCALAFFCGLWPPFLAEGWIAVAEGQTQLLSEAKKRRAEQACELRHSPTRPQGGAAPKKKSP
ncbi:hypothetical protein SGRA_2518 [Saprospira grandis str. Lewin]|uniref:Uncharacterized protein n=1 Tax=Saprospira grandis (strain Lewin) TaxID=984262 RepID=H6L5N0_SAPGL|nr:hypothetical protein SGRA_2518 [Saprospira grandis str. Lewin]